MMTSRRGFLGGLQGALAGFMVLPAAHTYHRLWRTITVPKWRILGLEQDLWVEENGIMVHKTGLLSDPETIRRIQAQLDQMPGYDWLKETVQVRVSPSNAPSQN